MESEQNQQTQVMEWWNRHPMTYDWQRTVSAREGSLAFYREIDSRFWNAARFARRHEGDPPFSALINYPALTGQRVLEIGCGAGAMTAQLAASGAVVTAVDLTARAVALTRRRLELFGLAGDVRQMDAEALSFPAESFDFVWSWGVIHHSVNTEGIITEIARVLKPGGEACVMVYHRNSICFWAGLVLIRGLLFGGLARHSIQDLCDKYSDGLIAKYFTADQLKTLFRRCFSHVATEVHGQKTDLWQLPRGRVKDALVRHTPDVFARWVTRRVGGFLVIRALK